MVWGFGKKKAAAPQRRQAKTAVLPFSAAPVKMAVLTNTQVSYDTIILEGYQNNPIAFRCIDMIKTCVASINIDVIRRSKKGDVVKVESGPLNDLIDRPNPFMSWSDFISQFITYYYTAGAAFIVRNPESGAVKELFLLRPDLVELNYDNSGRLTGYSYAKGTSFYRVFPVDFITGASAVMAMVNFDPARPESGFSFFQPASQGIDSHNAISRWNTSLVMNGARPSGALKYSEPDGGGTLSEEQFNRIREQIEQDNSGPRNSGRPLLLEGNFEWLEMQISPKDMDYQKSKNSASIDVCTAFGVPPQLIGVPGSQTYANYAEARLAFWENTVLPLADRIIKALNRWLVPLVIKTGGVELSYDMNDIPALAEKRQQQFAMAESATFLTQNEKRKLCGFDDIPGGDALRENQDQPMDRETLRNTLIGDGMKPETADKLSKLIFNVKGD